MLIIKIKQLIKIHCDLRNLRYWIGNYCNRVIRIPYLRVIRVLRVLRVLSERQ